MSDLNTSKQHYDMASAMEATGFYDGKDEEKAIMWLRDIRIVSEITKLSSSNTLRLMMLKLTDCERSWCSLIFETRPEITQQEFITLFKQRFGNATKSQETLEKFMTAQPPKNREEFLKMLNAANSINDTGLLKTSALIRVVITKSPKNLRALLFQVAGNEYDWQEIYKVANESHWITYPNLLDISIDRAEGIYKNDRNQKKFQKKKNFYKNYKKENFEKKLFCALHGEGDHRTENCSAIKKMESNGFAIERINEIRALDDDSDKKEESDIKIKNLSFIQILIKQI